MELRGNILFAKDTIVKFIEDEWCLVPGGQKGVVLEDCFDWEKTLKVRWIKTRGIDFDFSKNSHAEFIIDCFELDNG